VSRFRLGSYTGATLADGPELRHQPRVHSDPRPGGDRSAGSRPARMSSLCWPMRALSDDMRVGGPPGTPATEITCEADAQLAVRSLGFVGVEFGVAQRAARGDELSQRVPPSRTPPPAITFHSDAECYVPDPTGVTAASQRRCLPSRTPLGAIRPPCQSGGSNVFRLICRPPHDPPRSTRRQRASRRHGQPGRAGRRRSGRHFSNVVRVPFTIAP
jgi:hypothetical protein